MKVPTIPRVRLDQVVNRAGWLTVVTTALTLSAWSLYWVARRYGLPIPLACIVSASFDGSAIVCADLALRYARTNGDSGLGPRLGVFTLAGLSAYLNMQHAVIAHDPGPARILFAAPPVIAVTLFEFHSRWERRSALRRAGRVPAAVPVFGRWAWMLFPLRTPKLLRRVVGSRMAGIETQAGVSGSFGNYVRGVSKPPGQAERVSETRPGVPGSIETLAETPAQGNGVSKLVSIPGGVSQTPRVVSPPSNRVVREWARIRGISTPDRGPVPQTLIDQYTLECAGNGHGSP